MTTKQNLLPIGSLVRYNRDEPQTQISYGVVIGHFNAHDTEFNTVRWFSHKMPFPDGGYYTSSLILISQVTTMNQVHPIGTLVKHRYSLDDDDLYGIIIGHDDSATLNLVRWLKYNQTDYLYNSAIIVIVENK